MSSAQTTITQLPVAGPILGTEAVPIVQGGQTRQTTTAALAAANLSAQSFLTVVNEPTLANSQYFSTGTGLGLQNGGAQSYLRVTLNGASGSLETAGNGIIVKTNSNTVTNRLIGVSGNGLGITNGDGIAGNPTLSLSGLAQAFANMSGTGLVVLTGASTVTPRSLLGTTDQIAVTNGDGVSGSPTIGLASDAVFPGVGAVTLPVGTTAQQPSGVDGQIRYNTDVDSYEGFSNGSWTLFNIGGVTTFDAGTTGFTPSTATSGAVTLSGTLNVANGGTGQTSYTDGELLIGNTTGNTLTKATLTAGTGITITNGNGSISIDAINNGTVTSVTATSPVASTGGATPDISMPAATTSVSGYLTSTDWTTFNSKGSGTVTSVAATVPSFLSVTGSPITTSGTLAITLSGTALPIANGGTGATTLAGASIATYSGIETLANKRIDPRVLSVASASSVTPTIADYDEYAFTALAATLTINAPVGTPLDGNTIIFRFLDNGTSRTLTWNAAYVVIGVTLPTTTTASKTTYVGCIYNANNTRWDVVAVTTQA